MSEPLLTLNLDDDQRLGEFLESLAGLNDSDPPDTELEAVNASD